MVVASGFVTDTASCVLENALRYHANVVQLPDWYRGRNAPSPIQWFVNQLARGNLLPAALPIAVCEALEKFDIASTTFQSPITPRGANTFFLVGTIRERWLILGQKSGGIEPGFLMVNILNPDGAINLTLARELWQLLGGSKQFRQFDEIRSIDNLLTLLDEVREAKLLGVYLSGLQAGRWEQPLYLLKQDYDENYFRPILNTSGVGGIVKSEVRQSHSIFLRMFFENIQPVTRHYGAPWGAY
ncbi:MAG: hypothetical protein GY821_18215 [Gammaproteobacteria bacterium]|nr:hypothetical protein [Gammaproteobacteria bacterium]